MKIYRLLLPALGLFLLSACIEFDEVTELKPNGSVDFTLTVLIPELPKTMTDEKSRDLDREMEEVLQALGGSAQLTGRGEETKYGKQRVWFSAKLPSLSSLGDFYSGMGKASAKDDQAGKKPSRETIDHIFSQNSSYRVEKTKAGNLKISRELKPGKSSKKKPAEKSSQDKKEKELSQNMEEVMMNSMTFRFEFVAPTEIISSNALGKFGQLLRWDASLGYLSEHSFKMEMEIASTPELEAVLLKK